MSVSAAAPILVALVLAGCVAGEAGSPLSSSASVAPTSVDPSAPASLAPEPGFLTGLVVDPELVPIAEADVIVTPGDVVGTTNVAGEFKLGPFEAGEYLIVAEKKGYSKAEVSVTVTDDPPAKLTMKLEPIASDVPYHETKILVAYVMCHVVVRSEDLNAQILNAPCVAVVDLVTGTSGTTPDKWKFPFLIDKPGFKTLVMEMVWSPQTFGTDGLLQLTTKGTAETGTSGSVTVAGTVYGDTQASPFHAMIHAGHSYWTDVNTRKPVYFYPEPNATEKFEMLVAGGGGNTTLRGSAVFVEFRPTAYLTFFFNRHAAPDFSALPDD